MDPRDIATILMPWIVKLACAATAWAIVLFGYHLAAAAWRSLS